MTLQAEDRLIAGHQELCNSPRSLPRKKAELVMIISLAASVRNRAGRADFLNALEQDFVGGAQERRPWANKREDRPKGAPNSSPPQPGFDPDARRKRGNNLRMEPVIIAARYKIGLGQLPRWPAGSCRPDRATTRPWAISPQRWLRHEDG